MEIYLINLDSRIDRLDSATANGLKFNFEFDRIGAIDSAGFSNKYVTPQVGACFESHRLAWQNLVKSGKSIGLVLEDDFDFKSFSLVEIENFFESRQIDFLQLGFLKTGFRDRFHLVFTNIKHSLLYVIKFSASLLRVQSMLDRILIREVILGFPELVPSDIRAGAHAYVIRSEMAAELIKLNDPVFLAADDFFMALGRMRGFSMHRFFGSRCGQIPSPTSIPSRFKIYP